MRPITPQEHHVKGRIKAAIFDVDGTLIDSNDLHVAAWREVFGWYGKVLSYDEVHAQIGKGGDQLMPVFLSREELENFGEELERRRVELFTTQYLPQAKPFPKARELLQRVHAEGVRIALASSAKEQELEQHRKNLGIEGLVEGATSADDAERSKPYPDIFVAALKTLPGIHKNEAMVIGDTPYDAQAAAKAGLKIVGVLSGGFAAEHLRREGVVAVYRDVAELLERYDESPLTQRPR